MALKTFINGSMVNLTPVGKPPVTFVNGAKKRLVKGVTFINGEKVVLWDTNRLQIDYIDTASINNATQVGTAFFANKDYVAYNYNYMVTRLNVQNLGAVTVDAQVSIGDVLGFSSVDSTSSTAVYYARNLVGSSTTFNQLNVGVVDGGIVASNSQSLNTNLNVRALGYLGAWINSNGLGNTLTYRYIWVRSGDTNLYNYQAVTTSGSLSGYIAGETAFTKLDSETLVGRLQLYGGDTTIGEFTTNGYTAKSSPVGYRDFLTDGNTIACAGDGFGLYTRNISGLYTEISHTSNITNHYERLIGKCRNYYYTVAYPTVVGGIFYLHIWNANGVLVETLELSNLSYSSSEALSDQHLSSVFVPQLSQTGYLCFRGEKNKIVRIQCY